MVSEISIWNFHSSPEKSVCVLACLIPHTAHVDTPGCQIRNTFGTNAAVLQQAHKVDQQTGL